MTDDETIRIEPRLGHPDQVVLTIPDIAYVDTMAGTWQVEIGLDRDRLQELRVAVNAALDGPAAPAAIRYVSCSNRDLTPHGPHTWAAQGGPAYCTGWTPVTEQDNTSDIPADKNAPEITNPQASTGTTADTLPDKPKVTGTDDDYCGAEPPSDGRWGDCWCTLPTGHDGQHQCGPCTARHGAPGWDDVARDALGTDAPPLSTCPRTDHHDHHTWPEQPDTPAICPGHPAPPQP